MTTIRPTVSSAPTSGIISGWRYRLLELKLLSQMARVAFRSYGHPYQAWQAMRGQISVNLQYRSACQITKALRINGRIYLQMVFPQLFSPAASAVVTNELHKNVPIPGHQPGLTKILLAITKKCSLQCAHCYEWDALNGRESLTAEDILTIIRKFQVNGVGTIELGGGEPLNRFSDLVRILQESDTQQTDFWITTSGYRLSAERAVALREAGMIGAAVSLDHWDAAAHDRFRGMEGSFEWARQAVQHARAAGLAVCLALTAMREFCTPEHLWRYAQLAREWGVHFIRILEPIPVGHFAGHDVLLRPAEIAVLEDFVRKIQRERAYRDFPVVEYYAPNQRQVGCAGAGKRFLYVDTDGEMHACPFCRNKCGSAVDGSIEMGIANMKQANSCRLQSV